MTRSFELAAFIASVEGVAPSARAAAVRSVLDVAGSAIAGAATPGGRAAHAAARRSWGAGPASVWFSGEALTPPGAAFVNSAYASMLDLDDGNRAAAGHPGAAIVPAVLATAQVIGADAERILTAIAIGYEIGVRVSAARDVVAIRTTDTGQWCGYGVAAAAGWLRGLSPDAIAHAMAIAGHTASGQFATGWTRVGHNVKEGIPWATATGLAAVDLAVAGYTGPVDLLDDTQRYDQQRLIADLGGSWLIESSYLKIYSCCRWAHAPIDAVLQLQAAHGLSIDSIEEIEIATFARGLSLLNETAPASVEAAQYSIPFCVALAMVHGAAALLPLDAKHLSDATVQALAGRVRLRLDPQLDPLFPAMTPSRVSILHNGERVGAEVMTPRGEPSNPLSQVDLEDKFEALAAGRLSAVVALRLKSKILSMNHVLGITDLIDAFTDVSK